MSLDAYVESLIAQGYTRFEALEWIATSDEARGLFTDEFIFQAYEKLTTEFSL